MFDGNADMHTKDKLRHIPASKLISIKPPIKSPRYDCSSKLGRVGTSDFRTDHLAGSFSRKQFQTFSRHEMSTYNGKNVYVTDMQETM